MGRIFWGLLLLPYFLCSMQESLFLSLTERYRQKEYGLLYTKAPRLSSIQLCDIFYLNHRATFRDLLLAETEKETRAINSFGIELRNQIRALEPIAPALSVCFFALPSSLFYDLFSFVNYIIKFKAISSVISITDQATLITVWEALRKKYEYLPGNGPGKAALDGLRGRIDRLKPEKIARTKSCAVEIERIFD